MNGRDNNEDNKNKSFTYALCEKHHGHYVHSVKMWFFASEDKAIAELIGRAKATPPYTMDESDADAEGWTEVRKQHMLTQITKRKGYYESAYRCHEYVWIVQLDSADGSISTSIDEDGEPFLSLHDTCNISVVTDQT